MLTGIALIAKERERQITEKGWTSTHDDMHKPGDLAIAAGCYIRDAKEYANFAGPIPPERPWLRVFWKPTPKNRIRELMKAGALIAAEIDQLQRLEGE